MTGEASSVQATARSPLEFVACSSCHAPHDATRTLPLFLTDCAHTLCQSCTANATAHGEGTQPPSGVITCPACGQAGPVVRLDLASSLEHCFRPLQDLIAELGMAAEWQLVNLVDQLAYFRQKCTDQKQMLAKAATELKKMRDLKDRVAELSRQNEALQQQLAAAATPHPLGRSFAQSAAAHDQNVPPAYGHRPPPPPPTQSRGQKRPRGNSPERNAFFDDIASASRSPSVSSATLALAPGRLSLTPAQQKQTAARLSAQSSMQNRGPAPPTASSSSTSKSADGRASRQGGPAPRNAAEESSKDRLARFAYNPSRASNRSAATATPALPPPQEHFAPPARASTAQAESPFYYNVPLTTGAPEHETQQQHRYDYLPSDSFASVDVDDDNHGFGGRPTNGHQQDDRQLMPPPPLPSSRRQPQQHFVASNASYNTPSTQLGGGTAQPRQYFVGAQQSPATRGPGMISRPASTSLPPRPSSTSTATSTSTSHRQPFRPASVAAAARSHEQSSTRFGAGVRTGGGGY
ncbi:hypothetical protein JCM8115_005198 [Rhodotorula mucilaginosa]